MHLFHSQLLGIHFISGGCFWVCANVNTVVNKTHVHTF